MASVALALAIPFTVDGGDAFPARDEILFIAFSVVLATLVFQGLTLPWLVRRLRVSPDAKAEQAFERELAERVLRATRRRLKEIQEEDLPDELLEQVARRAYDLGVRIYPDILEEDRREGHEKRVARLKRLQRINGELLSAARYEVLNARSEPGADPEIVDRVLHQLDMRSLRGAPPPDQG